MVSPANSRPSFIGRELSGQAAFGDNRELYFNITHSAGLAAIAFTTIGELAIDVEAIRYNIAARNIASANFTKKEAALVAIAVMLEDRELAFVRLWSRKGAVFKAAGCGISPGLDAVDVSEDPPNLVWLTGAAGPMTQSCWMVDLEALDGFVGAVAGPPGRWCIRRWAFGADDVIGRFVESYLHPSPQHDRISR